MLRVRQVCFCVFSKLGVTNYSNCRFPFLENNSFVFSPATYRCFDVGLLYRI